MSSEPLSCELQESTRANQRLEWANLNSHAIEILDIPGGIRIEFHADMYEQVEEFFTRETHCCDSWLTLRLVRQYNLLLLSATAKEEQGQSAIRSMVRIDES